MDSDERAEIKAAFQADPEQSPVRLLVATDAASEGIKHAAETLELRSIGATGALIRPFLQESLAPIPEEVRSSNPKLATLEAYLEPLAASLELFFVRACGRLDAEAICGQCGHRSIIHGHIDLGGVDYYDNYFSWCTNCFWCWHTEDSSTYDSGLRELDYETNTYR